MLCFTRASNGRVRRVGIVTTGFGALLMLTTGMLLPGCKVDKYLEVASANEVDGTLTMQYEHGFEEYVLHWENAQGDAEERCAAWGYSGAAFTDSGTIQCTEAHLYGCVSWRVTYTVRCTK